VARGHALALEPFQKFVSMLRRIWKESWLGRESPIFRSFGANQQRKPFATRSTCNRSAKA
jgi:hypothetical protein